LSTSLSFGWGSLSALLAFVSAFYYMRAIYKKEIKRPVISTLTLWLVIGLLFFLSSLEMGVGMDETLLPIFMGVVNPAIVLLLALRHGEYSWKKVDTKCAIVCAVTIVVWQTTSSPLLGLLGGVIADTIAATPMAIKSWEDPLDEPVFPWIMFTIASAVNLFAIKEWEMRYWVFPVYMTLMGIVISFPLVLGRVGKSVRA
jgi:hypothetical protein